MKGSIITIIVLFVVLVGISATRILINNNNEEKNGEKLTVTKGIEGSTEIFKAVVNEKEATLYRGNVIVHCAYAYPWDKTMRIDVLVPMVQANELAVGDTISYIRTHISSKSSMSSETITIPLGFWVDEDLITK